MLHEGLVSKINRKVCKEKTQSTESIYIIHYHYFNQNHISLYKSFAFLADS